MGKLIIGETTGGDHLVLLSITGEADKPFWLPHTRRLDCKTTIEEPSVTQCLRGLRMSYDEGGGDSDHYSPDPHYLLLKEKDNNKWTFMLGEEWGRNNPEHKPYAEGEVILGNDSIDKIHNFLLLQK